MRAGFAANHVLQYQQVALTKTRALGTHISGRHCPGCAATHSHHLWSYLCFSRWPTCLSSPAADSSSQGSWTAPASTPLWKGLCGTMPQAVMYGVWVLIPMVTPFASSAGRCTPCCDVVRHVTSPRWRTAHVAHDLKLRGCVHAGAPASVCAMPTTWGED